MNAFRISILLFQDKICCLTCHLVIRERVVLINLLELAKREDEQVPGRAGHVEVIDILSERAFARDSIDTC